MTIEEASEHFGISIDKLHLYENQGLFDCHKGANGYVEYTDDLIDYIGIIDVLTDAGAEIETLRSFMRGLMQSSITKEEKLRYLRAQRQKLLNTIHLKQRSLDQLDYIIFDINKTSDSAQ